MITHQQQHEKNEKKNEVERNIIDTSKEVEIHSNSSAMDFLNLNCSLSFISNYRYIIFFSSLFFHSASTHANIYVLEEKGKEIGGFFPLALIFFFPFRFI